MTFHDLIHTWLFPASVGWFLSVVVHELGHVVVGRLVGFGVVAVGIGFRRAVGVRVYGCRVYVGEIDGTGLTVFVPRRWQSARWRHAVAGLGGSVANLLLAVGAVALWRTTGWTGWAVFGGVSLLAGGLALVPWAWASPAGLLFSDGHSLRQLWRSDFGPWRAVAVARQSEPLRDAIGEPRPFVFYADLAAVEWMQLGAAEAAVRWRAEADAARIKSVGRLERAVQTLVAGLFVDKADTLAEVLRLVPADADFLAYAGSLFGEGVPSEPWARCRLLREAAAIEPDPTVAAELYREAVVAAFEPAAGLGDHTDDLAAFTAATDELLLAYRRAVRAVGGDVQQATRELLAPVYAGWRVPVASLPAVAAQHPIDAEGDRRRWRLAVRLAVGQAVVGAMLIGLAAAMPRPVPLALRLGVAVGIAALFWSLVPLLTLGVCRLLPASRPGRGESGWSVLYVAVAAIVLAAGQTVWTASLAFDP